MTVDDVEVWDMHKAVKAECGNKIYDILLEPDIYDYVLPMPGARDGIYRLLSAGYRVVYVSACIPGTDKWKMDWLVRWDFLTKTTCRRDFVCAYDKSLVRADFLFDDKPDNVRNFQGRACLVRRPHNASDRADIREQIDGVHVALDWIRKVDPTA